jgi:AraC-like DNA-binding protein
MHLVRQISGWFLDEDFNARKSIERIAFDEGYRLDAIGERLGCCARHLTRIFLRDIGLPPKQWLKNERMLVARRLLEAGDYPASVGKKLGFASASNFGREFVATYRVSPGRYREQFDARRRLRD